MGDFNSGDSERDYRVPDGGVHHTGPVYAIAELSDNVCPWCIADGSAAERFAAFSDTAAFAHAVAERAGVDGLRPCALRLREPRDVAMARVRLAGNTRPLLAESTRRASRSDVWTRRRTSAL